jgi:glycosyltransferase involved in cell wall biosynthesis
MEIKIAFSHEEYPAAGTEKVTEWLTTYLVGNGYKVYVFVEKLSPGLLSESDKKNMEFIPTVFGKENTAQLIADEIERRGIDIFVTPAHWQVDLAKLRKLTRAKIVFTYHFKAVQEIDDFFISRRLKAIRALRSGKIGKFLMWFLVREPYEFISGHKKRKILKRHKVCYENSDLFTVLCEPYKTTILKELAKKGEDHVAVIKNWIPPHMSNPATDGTRKNVALYIGRLNSYQKRIDRLIDIWAKVEKSFPDWELWIVGQGPEHDNLVRQSEQLGLKNVKFRDFTTNPGDYYSQASILCLTSSNEGWPLVIAEGQQSGVAPIAFDCCAGVHDQMVPSGENGFLIRPFNKRKYAQRLARLMSDEGLRREMSRNVVVKAREYSDENRLAKWDIEFRKLLTQR